MTELVGVLVPLRDDQSVAVRHRIKGGRQVDDLEPGSAGQPDGFPSAGGFHPPKVHRSWSVDKHRVDAALRTLLCESAEYPLLYFGNVRDQASFNRSIRHSPIDSAFSGDPIQELAVTRRQLNSMGQALSHV